MSDHDTRVNEVRYPEVQVVLSGNDGNAANIIGLVSTALRRKARVDDTVIAEFRREATSGDYDHVIATALRWVDVL